ncbi:MAG: OstA-like protein [Chryseolinea sp.]
MKKDFTFKITRILASYSLRVLLLSILLFGISSTALSQKKVKLKKADQLKGGKDINGTRFERLIGDVVFTQNKTTIYCDSAYFYKAKNTVEAFGRVRITEGDSVTITAKKLEYDGNAKLAKLRNDVVFTKLNQSTLYTDHLDYDRPKNLAYYFNGGRLVDSINVLTSRKGYYDLNSNMASFKREVHVKNPDYTMTSDSLQYNSQSKILFFRTPTTVVDKDSSVFVYNGGQYETNTRKSDINLGTMESTDFRLVSKNYKLDDIRKVYRLRDDVVMTSKKENLIIYGQAVDYYKLKGISKIYTNAYLAKITEGEDTLFISADTLVSIENADPKKKRLLAYNHVKIFRNDLQGIADSLEYRQADSTIYFYHSPVLWTDGNQMSADSIRMLIKNKTIDRIFMVANSFVISKDSAFNFNQIKGRRMTSYFKNKKIDRVIVEGNGENIFAALSDEDHSLMGVNKIICSNITIRFKEGKVHNLIFLVKPDARFIPPHELKEEDKYLKGFNWQEDQKPKRSDVVKSSLGNSSPTLEAPKRL